MVLNRLNNFQNTFQKKNDEDCYYMCEDLKNMLLGKNADFYY